MAKTSKYQAKQTSQDFIKPEPLNDKQGLYLKYLQSHPIVVATGVPGSSKTFIPASLGACWLVEKKIEKVVIVRNAVGVGKSIGLLPGTLNEKLDPYMVPVTDAMKKAIGVTRFEYFFKKKAIEFAPLEMIKGRSFDNCLVICDEAEDLDIPCAKALLTRIGINTTFAITGDIQQQNLKGKSGLNLILEVANKKPDSIAHLDFKLNEIVRSGTCKEMTEALIELGYY